MWLKIGESSTPEVLLEGGVPSFNTCDANTWSKFLFWFSQVFNVFSFRLCLSVDVG